MPIVGLFSLGRALWGTDREVAVLHRDGRRRKVAIAHGLLNGLVKFSFGYVVLLALKYKIGRFQFVIAVNHQIRIASRSAVG